MCYQCFMNSLQNIKKVYLENLCATNSLHISSLYFLNYSFLKILSYFLGWNETENKSNEKIQSSLEG